MQPSKKMKLLLATIVILGWFAIMAQLYLIIENRITSITETIIRFFSYFTVLTNILAALCCTLLLLNKNSVWRKIFSKPTTITAIAVYITIVGIVYNLILRFLWKPEGLQWIVDELLHTIIPILFILLWFIFIPKQRMKWKSVYTWLLYPFCYLIFVLIRGYYFSFYPYPFINVNELGYNKVLINSTGIFGAFLIVSLLYIAIDRAKKR